MVYIKKYKLRRKKILRITLSGKKFFKTQFETRYIGVAVCFYKNLNFPNTFACTAVDVYIIYYSVGIT